MDISSPKFDDVSSLSNPESFLVSHISLNWNVDFENRKVFGSAKLTVLQKKSGENELHLDSRKLEIHKVHNAVTSEALEFSVEANTCEAIGQRIIIKLPESAKESAIGTIWIVLVEYSTDPEAQALQWMLPEQTAGKKFPYVYSQCQAIHARSLLPCQDTPFVKVTYDASVKVSKDLTALMSAISVSSAEVDDGRTFLFEQKVPIPSYLVAIVVGALESRDVGPRTRVWSEAEVVDAAAFEFAETEKYIQAAEALMGPYVWGRCDLLILPPSFPYGGMENPCLIFVTPTLLAGDRSLVDVIAHEISHHWTGNLYSCSSWQHFWLNEGHTTYMEGKICGLVESNDKIDDFMAYVHWEKLAYYIDLKGQEHPYTKLLPDLTGIDPDDAFNVVPYEKGRAFLFFLERKVGGPNEMMKFMRELIERFKYKSLDSWQWKALFLEVFHDLSEKGALDDIDWNAWFFTPGYPPIVPQYDDSMAKPCSALSDLWAQASTEQLEFFSADDLKSFSGLQIDEFLLQLMKKDPLPLVKIEKLDQLYGFHQAKNFENRFHWIRLCIKAEWESIIPVATKFSLVEQGRMKYTLPIVRDLFAWEKSKDQVVEMFKQQRRFMHVTTASLVAKELNI